MPTLQAYLLTKLQQENIPVSQIGRVEWYDDVVRGYRTVPLADFANAASRTQVAAIPESNRTKLRVFVQTVDGDEKIIQYDGGDFFIDDGRSFRGTFTADDLTT